MTPLTSDEQDAHDMSDLASGRDAALSHLMERHGKKIYNYLLRSLQNEPDAADLAQETFVRVYQNRDRYKRGQKFSSWLYAIAGNLVRDRFRWRLRHPQVSLEAESAPGGGGLGAMLVARDAAPDETVLARERAMAVQSALAALPLELREPLILFVYEGLSHAEIGEVVGGSAKAVEARIYRARNQLRQALQRGA